MTNATSAMTTASETAARLRERIETKNATIGIVGMGYVGLPLARAMHEAGFRVLGFDIDQTKITMLNEGRNYMQHLGDDLTTTLAKSDRFDATADSGRLGEADAVLLCVPTPLGEHREPDLSYVLDSTRMVAKTLREGQLVILESTTYPGTTRHEMVPILEAESGLTCGTDFFVAYSPEREDPGRADTTTSTIPKLVGGVDPVAGELAYMMYDAAIAQVHPVSSAEIAESAKLLENIYRAVNIAMVNELKVVLTDMGIDVWEVIDAASTKPFGFQPFYPGPGLGGHCIPIDPFYLTWKAREIGRATRFIELAGEVNADMPRYVLSRVTSALNDEGKSVRGSKILMLGLAYKPDVDDVRESPAAEILELLSHCGAQVTYHDPHVAEFPKMRNYDFDLTSVELSADVLSGADCVLIVTDHKAVDYATVGQHAGLIVDTRNAMDDVEIKGRLVKA